MKPDQQPQSIEEPEYVDEAFDSFETEDDPWESPNQTDADGPEKKDSDAGVDNQVPALSKFRPASRNSEDTVESGNDQETAANGNDDETAPSRTLQRGRPRHMQRPFPHGRAETVQRRSFHRQEQSQPALPAAVPHQIPASGKKPAKEKTSAPVRTNIPEWVVLEKLLAEHPDLPVGSVVLGVDEAGKPLVLALDDPDNGPLLIMGEDPSANRKHLRAILASGERINPPELLQIDVITPERLGFESKRSNLRSICEVGDTCVFDRLAAYLDTIEDRIRAEKQLPFQILVLDAVDELVERLAEDSLRFLRWMMRRGPQVGVHVFASIDSSRLEGFDLKTFRAFDLHLCGKITVEQTARTYTGIAPEVLKRLARGAEGCFRLDDRLVKYSIPEYSGG